MTYYSDSHEWVRIEGDTGRIGISNHAQKELGEIVYVQLPQIGQEVKAGDEVVILESTKAAADVYSPISGKVVRVNEALKKDVSLLNNFPEGEGYLFEVVPTHLDELDTLISEENYHKMTTL